VYQHHRIFVNNTTGISVPNLQALKSLIPWVTSIVISQCKRPAFFHMVGARACYHELLLIFGDKHQHNNIKEP